MKDAKSCIQAPNDRSALLQDTRCAVPTLLAPVAVASIGGKSSLVFAPENLPVIATETTENHLSLRVF
jgi:hypothetical protein